MKKLNEIKDEVAKEFGHKNWDVAFTSGQISDIMIDEIAKRNALETYLINDLKSEITRLKTDIFIKEKEVSSWEEEYKNSRLILRRLAELKTIRNKDDENELFIQEQAKTLNQAIEFLKNYKHPLYQYE